MNKIILVLAFIILLFSNYLYASTYYVCGNSSSCGSSWSSGSDNYSGKSESAPFATITKGISSMSGGDTLVVGNGTYSEQVKGIPTGSSSQYTTVKAEHDFGVLIDGSAWSDSYNYAISTSASNNYIVIQGFRVKMNQSNSNNQPVIIYNSNHVKVIRCGVILSGTYNNISAFTMSTGASYNLFEECYAFGGARYEFLVYQSDHNIVRKCVARNDYWNGTLQSAGFCNYDSYATVWENNIAIDTDSTYLAGSGYYGAYFGEWKGDYRADGDGTQWFYGNIFINTKNTGLYYSAGINDYKICGTQTWSNNVLWDVIAGMWVDNSAGSLKYTPATAKLIMTNSTFGNSSGSYNASSMSAGGVGLAVYDSNGSWTNSVQYSIFANNHIYGIAANASSDYNDFYGNTANAGGSPTPSLGSHSMTTNPFTNGLLYLPNSTVSVGGSTAGAVIMYQTGVSGTLYGESGYDSLTGISLWPFPNETQIKSDMAAYSGGGASGKRGFCTTGKQLNGTDTVTLTSYIWEYLGNQMPNSIYSTQLPGAPASLKIN
jgi:hypothetical protein